MSGHRIVVLGDKYQTNFMTPRSSRHRIERRSFVPMNKLHHSLDGVTIIRPGLQADLVHAHNRVPVGSKRFLMSFESVMPRRFSWSSDNPYTKYLNRKVASPNCRRLVAMSDFARRSVLRQHLELPHYESVAAKMSVMYPNVPLGMHADQLANEPLDVLRLIFVGGDFARKGGTVAVKAAEKALKRKLPLELTIVSSLKGLGEIWTDPDSETFYDEYLKLLELPNVTHLSGQPNSVVRDLLRRSHFSLLPTFADTFGFSAIESMADHTPVIATSICALPEFVVDEWNGLLLDLPQNEIGAWTGAKYFGPGRGDAAYARLMRNEIERLADNLVDRLEGLMGQPEKLKQMRSAARQTAESMFCADKAAEEWDAFYDVIVNESISADPVPVRESNGTKVLRSQAAPVDVQLSTSQLSQTRSTVS